jgi:hypothetical protein
MYETAKGKLNRFSAPADPVRERRSPWAHVSLNLLGGVVTAFGLLATTGVLTALFSEGPAPDRVPAALPGLVLVGAAAVVRTLLQAGAYRGSAALTAALSLQSRVAAVARPASAATTSVIVKGAGK